jgi:hypothetical protein
MITTLVPNKNSLKKHLEPKTLGEKESYKLGGG